MKISKYYSFGDYSASLDIEFDPNNPAELRTAYTLINDFEDTAENADTETRIE